MDLTPYVDSVRRELVVAAETSGDDARALAGRLTAPLESALRLTLLDALSGAADEITRDLAPGSVEVRLRGRDPGFVVTLPPFGPAEPAPSAAEVPPAVDDDGATARINLRLPEHLKARAEQAAAHEGLSVNAWLVRAVAAALGSAAPPRRSAQGRYTGWAR